MKIDDTTRFRIAPGTIRSRNDDTYFLTHLDTGRIYELNPTASSMLDAFQKGEPVKDVLQDFHQEYVDIPSDELRRDIQEILADLLERGLVEVCNDE